MNFIPWQQMFPLPYWQFFCQPQTQEKLPFFNPFALLSSDEGIRGLSGETGLALRRLQRTEAMPWTLAPAPGGNAEGELGSQSARGSSLARQTSGLTEGLPRPLEEESFLISKIVDTS